MEQDKKTGQEEGLVELVEAKKIAGPYTSFNRWFLIPFIIWVILGGIALLMFSRQQLFAAFNTHHTSTMDAFMHTFTDLGEGTYTTVVVLVLMGLKAFRNWWYVIAALLTNAFPNILVQIIKSSVNAPRPLNYFRDAPWIHTLPEWPRLMERSFPSGHSSSAFCFFCFMAMLLPRRYRPFGLLFFFMALTVGYSRMYLAAHFFLDVYVGSVIAVVFVVLVMAIMNRYKSRFIKTGSFD
jgi:membrane-associated phospholipid phosphatase